MPCYPMPAAGGAEVQAETCELDALCPAMPIDVFTVYDVSAVQDIQPRTAEEVAAGLPTPLHMSLLSAMMLTELAGDQLADAS